MGKIRSAEKRSVNRGNEHAKTDDEEGKNLKKEVGRMREKEDGSATERGKEGDETINTPKTTSRIRTVAIFR